jgi:hypothetical protein
MARYEYHEPVHVNTGWSPAATYVRTSVVPELSQLSGLERSVGLVRFGLRRAARVGRAQASRHHVSARAWTVVRGPIVAYCPRQGCERKHLLEPPEQYGPKPEGPIWPAWVNPVTGEDLTSERNERSDAYLWARARRIPKASRVRGSHMELSSE